MTLFSKIIVFLISLFICTGIWGEVYAVPRDCGGYNIEGPSNIACPPTAMEIEGTGVRYIVFLWGSGVVLFSVFLAYQGYQYLMIAINPDEAGKIEEFVKVLKRWIIAYIVFILAKPIMATILFLFIDSANDCYKELAKPQLTFSFPAVCDDETK